MTTRNDIRAWLDRATEEHSHMIVVCDSYDHSNYPVFVNDVEDINERIANYQQADMQQIMEVYNLSKNIDEQLSEHRAYNL